MASTLQRLAAALSFSVPVLDLSGLPGLSGPDWQRQTQSGKVRSHRKVAMDRREAAKARAKRRARRLGQA